MDDDDDGTGIEKNSDAKKRSSTRRIIKKEKGDSQYQ